MPPQNLRAVGDRIEQLLDELHTVADPKSVAIAEELLRSLTDLYGGGLERIVKLASEEAPEFAERLVDDELVGSLLIAHGLHPDDVETRVERALESVRPFLAEHDGNVELLEIDLRAAAVHVRLLAGGDGCGSSAVTLQLAVEAAIIEAAPEIATIDVDRPAPKPPAVPVTLAQGRERMTADPLAVIRRIRETAPAPRPRPGERCEMCTEPIPDVHNHLVDVEQRTLMCTCRGCWLLFTPQGAGGGHFKAVPERYAALPELRLSPGQWDSLQIPVSVAFFFVNSNLGRVCAFYPSPAGATESLLPLDTWDELTAEHNELATLEPDVEAFLVRVDRAGGGHGECYLVPIDTCYELVGQLRSLWRGFDGGTEAHVALEAFFDNVRARAR